MRQTTDSILQALDFRSQILLRFAELLLKPSKQLVFFAFSKGQIVVAQLPIFLLQFALHFVPIAFEL